jgi:hypothetical protein
MTLKQFAYVAAGAGIGLVCYALPIFVFIKIPLVLVFVGIGVIFAFVPFQGRPLDVMIKNFFKAAFSPTQYVYQKMDNLLLAKSSPPAEKNKLDKKETVFFESLNQYAASKPSLTTPAVQPKLAQTAPPRPTPKPPTEPNEELQKTAALLEKELEEAKAKEATENKTNPEEYLKAHQKVLELQKNLNDLTFQKQELESKLISLQQKMEAQGKPIYAPSVAHPEQLKETKFVRSIPQSMQKNAGLPTAPEFPNVITGIIKDPRGNPLANILVEVKDSQGNAVRAFKTNALGQFASATPLVNGEYTIGFEDPRGQNKFDTVAFKAAGEVILPIEIISVDQREELRRSLFN